MLSLLAWLQRLHGVSHRSRKLMDAVSLASGTAYIMFSKVRITSTTFRPI